MAQAFAGANLDNRALPGVYLAVVMGRHAGALVRFDSYDRLPRMQVQTLILHGDQDRLNRVENARILHDRIPNSKLQILPDVGHCFFWEKPAESAEAVVKFLSSVPAPA